MRTDPPPLDVRPLRPDDRTEWEVLARGYKDFYLTRTSDARFETTWQALLHGDSVHGLGAFVDGRLAGIAHYLFHPGVWADRHCYLADLFTAPAARGQGVARALIDAVAAEARGRGAERYYWHTHEGNAVARALYDQVARHAGFIRYDFPLQQRSL